MRIAHFSHNLECGGSMAMVVNLAIGMAQQGHEVDVVLLDQKTGSDHEAMWTAELQSHGVPLVFLGRRLGKPGTLAAVRLWSLIRRRQYDVLHSHLPMPDAIAGLVRRFRPARFAHVMTVHNSREPRSRLMTMLAAGARVVYCSQAARTANSVAIAPGIVIPNGIVRHSYSDAMAPTPDVRRSLVIPPDAVVIVAIGRLCPQKNLTVAIDALGLLADELTGRDTHLLLCGDGPDRLLLQDRVHQLRLDEQIHFLGQRIDIPLLLQAADVFLSTSIYEGMPLAVLEALESGLPCVLSPINEHLEIAADVPGCFFASTSSPVDVAHVLLTAIHTLLTREGLGSERWEILQKYSIECCVESYLATYRLFPSVQAAALRWACPVIRQL